jgi:hypothetical protein
VRNGVRKKEVEKCRSGWKDTLSVVLGSRNKGTCGGQSEDSFVREWNEA